MANPFYARYIPKSLGVTSSKLDPIDTQPRSTKRRKTKLSFTPLTARTGEETQALNNPHAPNSKDHKARREVSKNSAITSFEDQLLDIAADLKNAAPTLKDDVPKKNKKNKKKKEKQQKNQELAAAENRTPLLTEEHLPQSDVSPLPNQDENAKHKTIRTKFETSTKVVSHLVENEAISMEPDLAKRETERAAPIETHGLVPLPQPPQVPDTDRKAIFSALPEWLAHPTIVSQSKRISLDSHVNPSIFASLKRRGYQDAFAIQAAIIPLLLPGPQNYSGDICISAATGSGKTLAYVLPMVEDLLDKPVTRLRGLVVVPTRELVSQVKECLDMCSSGSGLKIGTAVGSESLKKEEELLVEKSHKYDPSTYQTETEKLADEDEDLMDWDFSTGLKDDGSESDCLTNYVVDYTSKVDILICTPGRIVDHIKSTKGFNLDHVEWLIMDEADRLLDESFQQWIETVIPALEYQPPSDPLNEQLFSTFHLLRQRKVRKIILSATMTRDISKLMALKLKLPKMVILETSKKENEDQDPPAPNELLSGSHDSIELPSTLEEIAVPINNAEEKPLHLIELLQKIGLSTDLSNKPQAYRKSSTPGKSEKESLSNNDDHSDDSISTSSVSSPASDNDSSASKPEPLSPKAAPRPSTHGTLVFTNNNENAIRLARLLALLRPSWGPFISTLTKSTTSASGRKTLALFRANRLSVLIASDRASRGLDIPNLAHVINYDMPTSVISYVHRVGRTARAGMEGSATTLVVGHEARWFWNEIARAKGIVRAGKVRRVESRLESWGERERKEYQNALTILGEEARGERDVKGLLIK